ncbi:substrate-binding domain-containing protein [Compostibacter hankyongensis]|uniref:Substrate-binding domain-containing protein n=2 Tax=Compostibacter hankyongensis TaxID=1007089 RepID=A0ABP8FGQ6_9BACT
MRSGVKKYIAGCLALLALGCHSNSGTQRDTQTSGTVHISVDESYKPLIDSEISVFETLHPDAHIIVDYKPEAECFKDLINDSAKLVIVTRDLNSTEKKYFQDNKTHITAKILAWDAVALIVNPANRDTTMTMDEVRALMGGQTGNRYELVFDHQNSSLVRYAIDSINRGKPLPSNTKAANGCAEVVDYVAGHENAVGVIGVSWISNPYDSTGLSFLNKIRVVGLMSDSTLQVQRQNPGFDPATSSYYFKPFQAYIALKSYPLTRAFYFVLREPYFGLGTGFANFLGGNQGQLIIGQHRLFPARLNIVFRDATIH